MKDDDDDWGVEEEESVNSDDQPLTLKLNAQSSSDNDSDGVVWSDDEEEEEENEYLKKVNGLKSSFRKENGTSTTTTTATTTAAPKPQQTQPQLITKKSLLLAKSKVLEEDSDDDDDWPDSEEDDSREIKLSGKFVDAVSFEDDEQEEEVKVDNHDNSREIHNDNHINNINNNISLNRKRPTAIQRITNPPLVKPSDILGLTSASKSSTPTSTTSSSASSSSHYQTTWNGNGQNNHFNQYYKEKKRHMRRDRCRSDIDDKSSYSDFVYENGRWVKTIRSKLANSVSFDQDMIGKDSPLYGLSQKDIFSAPESPNNNNNKKKNSRNARLSLRNKLESLRDRKEWRKTLLPFIDSAEAKYDNDRPEMELIFSLTDVQKKKMTNAQKLHQEQYSHWGLSDLEFDKNYPSAEETRKLFLTHVLTRLKL